MKKKFAKFLLPFFLFSVVNIEVFSQASIKWNTVGGGTATLNGNTDEGSSVKATADGGFIIAGNTNSLNGDLSGVNKGGVDIWVVKTNSTGTILWQKTFGGSNEDRCNSIALTSDGGYILTGFTYSTNEDITSNKGQADVWIVKLSSTGNIQWQKTYGGKQIDAGQSIVPTVDGYLIGGYTFSNDGDVIGFKGQSDVWIIKVDNNGALLWQKCLGGNNLDLANSIDATNDGNFIIAGYTYSNNGDVSGNKGQQDVWVVKINATGVILWQKTYGGSNNEVANIIKPTADGGYVFTGGTTSNNVDVTGNRGGLDVWAVKINSTGTIEWQKCLGGTGAEEASSLLLAPDGGYLISGYTYSNNIDVSGNAGTQEIWAVKINATGVLQWQNCLGGTNSESSASVTLSSDNAYVLVGRTSSNNVDVSGNQGGTDVWVVKLNNSNTLVWQKCLGGSESQATNTNSEIKILVDHELVTVGSSNSNFLPEYHGKEDVLITRYSAAGGIIWQKNYGGGESDYGTSVVPTSDSGCIVAGYTISDDGDVIDNHGGYDGWVIKLDKTGELQWQLAIGGSDDDIINAIIATTDGAYLAIGRTASVDGDVSGNKGGNDVWVIKIDALGNLVWSKCYGGTDEEEGFAVSATGDNGFVIAGYSYSDDGNVTDNKGAQDAWVLKINSTGILQWQKTIGGSNNEQANSIQVTSDAGFIVAATTASNDFDVSGAKGARDIWVVKLNSGGSILWQKVFGGSKDEEANSIVASTNGDYTVIGNTKSTDKDVTGFKGTQDVWIVNMSNTGILQWQKCFGGSAAESGKFIITNSIGNFLFTESTASKDGDLLNINPTLKALLKTWAVELNNCPASIITPASATSFCITGSVVLNANTGTGLGYQWKKDGSNIPNAMASSFTANATGQYSVVVTNTFGCSVSSSTIQVNANPIPTKPTITQGSSATICDGSSITLTSSTEPGISYQWLLEGIDIPNAINNTYEARDEGAYNVIVTGTGGCFNVSDQFNLSITALPLKPTITQSGAALVSNSVTGNQWYLNNVLIPAAIAQNYTPSTNGIYSVRVIISGCTSNPSDPFNYTITSQIDFSNNLFVKLFPNPVVNGQLITIDWKTDDLNKAVKVRVLDIMGKVMSVQQFKQSPASIQIIGLLGTYIIELITADNKRRIFKVVKAN